MSSKSMKLERESQKRRATAVLTLAALGIMVLGIIAGRQLVEVGSKFVTEAAGICRRRVCVGYECKWRTFRLNKYGLCPYADHQCVHDSCRPGGHYCRCGVCVGDDCRGQDFKGDSCPCSDACIRDRDCGTQPARTPHGAGLVR